MAVRPSLFAIGLICKDATSICTAMQTASQKYNFTQVCVQPRPLAENMALPALCESGSSAVAPGQTDVQSDGRPTVA